MIGGYYLVNTALANVSALNIRIQPRQRQRHLQGPFKASFSDSLANQCRPRLALHDGGRFVAAHRGERRWQRQRQPRRCRRGRRHRRRGGHHDGKRLPQPLLQLDDLR